MLEQRTHGWSSLTKQEWMVARLVSEGLTNQQVAHRIYVSPHTVNYHLRRIFKKLDISSRVQLAVSYAHSFTSIHARTDEVR